MNLPRILFRNTFRNNFISQRKYVKNRHPLIKTWQTLNRDFRKNENKGDIVYPEHADVVIIGGGYIGASAAFWLKTRAGEGLSVVVIDKDPMYSKTQKTFYYDMLTQHFSLPENMFLSAFSKEFFRNVNENLGDVDLQFRPLGNLLLASEKYAEQLEQNLNMQRDYGIKNHLLTAQEIQRKYPWINISDIKLGCIGTEGEGVFNSNELHRGFIEKSQDLGAQYVKAEVVGFEMEMQRDILMEGIKPGSYQKINYVLYKTEDDEVYRVKFAACIIAAGTDSAHIAKLAKIGGDGGLLQVPLPIEKREHNVYSIENLNKSEMAVSLNTPYIMDTSGLWLRKDGLQNNIVCGQIPSIKQDSGYSDSEIFEASLYNRYPHTKNAEVKIISTEFSDCNTYDNTGILGPHVYYSNLILATGFGQQGIQHSPGIGRAIAELVIDCQYNDIDLTRFGFDRILTNEPLIETNEDSHYVILGRFSPAAPFLRSNVRLATNTAFPITGTPKSSSSS